MFSSWFLMALFAAMIWGFTYAVSEYIVKEYVSPSFILLLDCLIGAPFYLIISILNKSLVPSTHALLGNPRIFVYIVCLGLCYITANLMIFESIKAKNATMANMVEVSYPLFTALFAYILYRDVQMNAGSISGFLLVLSGLYVIQRYA